MAEPLSLAANIASITVPALHGTRLLLDDIHSIRDAPKTIAALKEDISSVETALAALDLVPDSEWESLGQEVVENSNLAISSCVSACNRFRQDLQQWTRRSEDGKLSWRDRANVGFFKQQRIAFLSDRLNSCKTMITMTVGIATLYASTLCFRA
jgi:hypothetical protein